MFATEFGFGKMTATSEGLTVFLGNLSYLTTEKDIRDHFEECGDIDMIHVNKFADSGRCRGSGFVTFKDQQSMLNSFSLDDSEFLGGKIKVEAFSAHDCSGLVRARTSDDDQSHLPGNNESKCTRTDFEEIRHISSVEWLKQPWVIALWEQYLFPQIKQAALLGQKSVRIIASMQHFEDYALPSELTKTLLSHVLTNIVKCKEFALVWIGGNDDAVIDIEVNW